MSSVVSRVELLMSSGPSLTNLFTSERDTCLLGSPSSSGSSPRRKRRCISRSLVRGLHLSRLSTEEKGGERQTDRQTDRENDGRFLNGTTKKWEEKERKNGKKIKERKGETVLLSHPPLLCVSRTSTKSAMSVMYTDDSIENRSDPDPGG